MSATKNSRAKKGFAAIGAAAALGMMGVLGLSTSAMAAVGPDQTGAPTTGSLTVHKYLGLPDGGNNNGTELTGEDVPTLPTAQGVEFAVQRVGTLVGEGEDQTCVAIDLATSAGWDAAANFTGTTAPADPYCLVGNPDVQETGDNGAVTFSDLPLGLYYVTEGDDNGGNNIVQRAQPFYVTIPYPTTTVTPGEGDEEDVTTSDWNYNVHVYPKNQTMEVPEKTITERPDALTVGSAVTWVITAPIPQTAADMTEASVYDQLDSRLSYDSTVSVRLTDPEDAEAEAVTLTEGAANDFTVVESSTAGEASLTWQLTTTGLAKINAHKGWVITVTFKTTVDSVGNGQIDNGPGEIGDGYGASFNSVPTPGVTTPGTFWGQLALKKVDDSTTAKPLAGAEFKVFEKIDENCAATVPTTGVVATGASDAGGVVQWSDVAVPATTLGSPLGLWIENFEDVSAIPENATPSKDYCVYETKVPAGYIGVPHGSLEYTITPGSLEEGTFTDSVVNTPKEGPNLPLTGANGTILMTVGGLALVSIAGGLYMVNRRRALRK